MVAVAVPYEMRHAGAPWVVQPIVGGARDVVQNPLDGLLMFHRWPLHEPTDIDDGECKVRPGVDEVA